MSDLLELKNEMVAHREQAAATNSAILECTRAMGELAADFKVYIEKHENIQKRTEELRLQLIVTDNLARTNATNIAVITPVVDGVRGLLWKLALMVCGGMGGSAIILSYLTKGAIS